VPNRATPPKRASGRGPLPSFPCAGAGIAPEQRADGFQVLLLPSTRQPVWTGSGESGRIGKIHVGDEKWPRLGGCAVELRQLRFFIALAEELHFRRAAEREHIAQPAFSEQIHRLERELKVRLFDRTSHYVRITGAGRLFLVEVRQILAQVERAADVARRAGRGEIGHIIVGFIGSAANELTPLILRAFPAQYPSVGVELREFDFRDPSAGLSSKQSDVAFIRPPVEGQRELASETLFEEPRIAIMASDHQLANEVSVPISQLMDEPFIVGPSSTGVWRDFWLVTEHRGGRPPRLGPEANTIHEWLEIIAAGIGVSLTPASTERFYGRPGVAFVPVTGVVCSTVVVAWRKGPANPLVAAFVEVACEVASRFGEGDQ
jgi:DNA-binding transcriptional LysR family regulator